jgi:hypothetical protein
MAAKLVSVRIAGVFAAGGDEAPVYRATAGDIKRYGASFPCCGERAMASTAGFIAKPVRPAGPQVPGCEVEGCEVRHRPAPFPAGYLSGFPVGG